MRSTRRVHCDLTDHRGDARARRRLHAPQKGNRLTAFVCYVVSSAESYRPTRLKLPLLHATLAYSPHRERRRQHHSARRVSHARYIRCARPRRIVSTSGRTELDTEVGGTPKGAYPCKVGQSHLKWLCLLWVLRGLEPEGLQILLKHTLVSDEGDSGLRVDS